MVEFTGAWSRETAEAFLADAVMPLRLACHTPDGGLWMLSLWFRYRDGSLECATSADADVVRFLRHDADVAFEVSTNDPPYMGVRGQATASVADDDAKAVLRSLLERYLGGTDNDLARRLLSPDRDEVVLRLDLTRANSWDFSDRMRGFGGEG